MIITRKDVRVSRTAREKIIKQGGKVEGERGHWNVTFPEGTQTEEARNLGYGKLTNTTYTFPDGTYVSWDSEDRIID